jgi:hypothetical protein
MTATAAKCARSACECIVAPKGLFGKYCCEDCKEFGQVTELHCTCRHDQCVHPERHASDAGGGG